MMTSALVVGLLVSAATLLLARPLLAGSHQPAEPVQRDVEDPSRELLRQLRDLDEDLAGGKLSDDDHRRLRAQVEVQVVAAMDRPHPSRRTGGDRSDAGKARRADAGVRASGRSHVRRWVAALVVLVVAGSAVVVMLGHAVDARVPGGTLSGDAPTVDSADVTSGKAGS